MRKKKNFYLINFYWIFIFVLVIEDERVEDGGIYV